MTGAVDRPYRGSRMCSATSAGARVRACSAARLADRPAPGSTRTDRITSARLRYSTGGMARRLRTTASGAPARSAAATSTSLPAGESTFPRYCRAWSGVIASVTGVAFLGAAVGVRRAVGGSAGGPDRGDRRVDPPGELDVHVGHAVERMRPDLEGDRVPQLLHPRVVGHVALGAGVAEWPLALGWEHDGAPQPVFVALPALQGGERAVDCTPLEQSRGQPDRHPGPARRHPLVLEV